MTVPCETIGGKRLLFIMAVEAEYGPHLRARFTPLLTGVGPVEAALATGLALADLARADALPDLAICLGSAGSRICPLGEIFQIASVSWRDMDASRLGFAKGVTPFVDHPVDLPLVTPLALPLARLSTGANVVGGDDYAVIDADMVDMETFAVARACARFDVPLMGLRGVSDGPGELAHIHSWMELLGLIDERLALAVDGLEAALTNSSPVRGAVMTNSSPVRGGGIA
ncbi:MAG: 5'-methylthioadenosine/S-adenosylhomocysteine nucleosidase [Sphingobium sp.]|uniref:5'-methylthioadenosine/S-adenosylhomocysteine nucleosidase n=1 Tax=Sphingobium sp. TaxID=1912891 RepID=UPI002E200A51|nr:5'-methylthioadenosine/S-adenosylhomocysteine nucleosidase [Sphingobium sp.]